MRSSSIKSNQISESKRKFEVTPFCFHILLNVPKKLHSCHCWILEFRQRLHRAAVNGSHWPPGELQPASLVTDELRLLFTILNIQYFNYLPSQLVSFDWITTVTDLDFLKTSSCRSDQLKFHSPFITVGAMCQSFWVLVAVASWCHVIST